MYVTCRPLGRVEGLRVTEFELYRIALALVPQLTTSPAFWFGFVALQGKRKCQL